MDIVGPFNSLCVDSLGDFALVSCKPTLKHPEVRHLVLRLNHNDEDYDIEVEQSFTGGKVLSSLSRSTLFVDPLGGDNLVVCYGNDSLHKLCVCPVGSDEMVSSFDIDGSVVDVSLVPGIMPGIVVLCDSNLQLLEYIYK